MLTYLVRMLGGIPDGEQVSLGVIIGDQPTRLHGGGGEALHLVGLPHHVISLCEGSIQVAPSIQRPQGHVTPLVGMNDNGVRFQCLVRVREGGQNLIVHHDLIQGVGGGVWVFRDEDRHGLADVTDLV